MGYINFSFLISILMDCSVDTTQHGYTWRGADARFGYGSTRRVDTYIVKNNFTLPLMNTSKD